MQKVERVMVYKCSDRSRPYVPSYQVPCTECKAKCWISKVMLASIPIGTEPVCVQCFLELRAEGETFTPSIPDAALKEFRDYLSKADNAETN